MKSITLDGINPQNDVKITYDNPDMGYYHMNLKTNSFVNVNNKPYGINYLSSARQQLTKKDLWNFLEDHVREANLRLARGQSCGLERIDVDGKLVFTPKMLAYDKMPKDIIDLSNVYPQNDLKIKLSKDINIDWHLNVKENKLVDIHPEKDGLHFHDTGTNPVTPKMLKDFLDTYVKAGNNIWKEQKKCVIDSIIVDGKLVFDRETLENGIGKLQEQEQSKTASKDKKPNRIYQIGRLDTQDKINGWELIEAPTEEKALNFAGRLFNQEENDERPFSFVSDYVPVVLGRYNSMEEMGYGIKNLTPIKANDKPMPYEIELEKIKARETKEAKAEKKHTSETKKEKGHRKLGLHPKKKGRVCER